MKVVAIIPARMGASRFPGKPLHLISGIPMLGHIYQRVKLSQAFEEVYIATCDQEIMQYADSIGARAIMTSDEHLNCVSRTVEAVQKIQAKEDQAPIDFVAMVQGDEPTVSPQLFTNAVDQLSEDTQLLNIVGRITKESEFLDQDVIKVAINKNDEAMYMSREPIPTRCKGVHGPSYKQTGLIFFNIKQLFSFSQMERTPLESSEYVDMLRFLENGIPVKVLKTEQTCLSVDKLEDIPPVEDFLSSDPCFTQYCPKT